MSNQLPSYQELVPQMREILLDDIACYRAARKSRSAAKYPSVKFRVAHVAVNFFDSAARNSVEALGGMAAEW